MRFKQKQIKPLAEVTKERKALKRTVILFKIAVVFFVITSATYGVYDFYNSHNFRTPIEIKFQNPVPVKDTDIKSPVGSKSAGLVKQAYAEERELTDEEYIRVKFGNAGDIAVAVAKAESGLREDAYHVNTNGTIDLGVFQINTVHFEKEGCAPKDLLDFKKNVDCAYQIYEAQGFNPWVAYTSGSYLNKL